MAERPGIMVYFDLIDSLQDYTDAEAGLLFRAMLEYGKTGAIPEFSDRGMKTLWKSIQQKIDRDGEKYRDRCDSGAYAVYVREANKQGIEPLTFDDWKSNRYRPLSNDNEKNQLQQVTTTTTETVSETYNKERLGVQGVGKPTSIPSATDEMDFEKRRQANIALLCGYIENKDTE